VLDGEVGARRPGAAGRVVDSVLLFIECIPPA
jgi:hypothetical protein